MTCDWCLESATARIVLLFSDRRRVLALCEEHLELMQKTSREEEPSANAEGSSLS